MAVPDLSREVTVFVTSIGAPSYHACRRWLEHQDCTFSLACLEGIRPLSAALQAMLDRCRTPYYVQVDEDMLLYPHAVRTLYEHVSSAPEAVSLVVGLLHDLHLGQNIHGVKIARHGIARRFPWVDEPNVVRRLERMEQAGFRAMAISGDAPGAPPSPLGLHVAPATPAMLHDRYRTLGRLRRTFPRRFNWVEPLPALFLERVMKQGVTADLHALLGILAGTLAGPLPPGAELRDGRIPSDVEFLQQEIDDRRQNSQAVP
jgi:hypothetical protein